LAVLTRDEPAAEKPRHSLIWDAAAAVIVFGLAWYFDLWSWSAQIASAIID